MKIYKQHEVGFNGYGKCAKCFWSSSEKRYSDTKVKGLTESGREIIQTCLNGGGAEGYEKLIKK